MNNEYFYKCIIEYQGTQYLGWQIQPEGLKTIQGQLEKAICSAFNLSSVKTIGSGRTDAGVHAIGQCVKISMGLKVPVESFFKAVNNKLPNDISIKNVWESDFDFHPIFSAVRKTYCYYFSDTILNCFSSKYIWQVNKNLNLGLVEEASNLFIGEHDFLNFFNTGTPVKSTVREIFDCKVYEVDSGRLPWMGGDKVYCFEVIGSGFLKQMVRLMVGAAISIGVGKNGIKDLQKYLTGIKRTNKLAAPAPAHGLFLMSVDYQ